ncbi:hypothetical protein [Nocardia sp. NPDC057353]|uniref:hypothetical protein n=1 Tax=Nocardia sp. NPDC057353 TaxID=3346104 RepID=UPI003628F1BC
MTGVPSAIRSYTAPVKGSTLLRSAAVIGRAGVPSDPIRSSARSSASAARIGRLSSISRPSSGALSSDPGFSSRGFTSSRRTTPRRSQIAASTAATATGKYSARKSGPEIPQVSAAVSSTLISTSRFAAFRLIIEGGRVARQMVP